MTLSKDFVISSSTYLFIMTKVVAIHLITQKIESILVTVTIYILPKKT